MRKKECYNKGCRTLSFAPIKAVWCCYSRLFSKASGTDRDVYFKLLCLRYVIVASISVQLVAKQNIKYALERRDAAPGASHESRHSEAPRGSRSVLKPSLYRLFPFSRAQDVLDSVEAAMVASSLVAVLATIPLLPILFLLVLRFLLRFWGYSLRASTQHRREVIRALTQRDVQKSEDLHGASREVEDGWEKVERAGTAPNGQKQQDDYTGIIGFFHPFCNAGGGGERVLWAAIAATQRQWPHAICTVYTGDHDVDKGIIVSKVKERFDITMREETLHFIYLTTRHFVLPSTYPHFTLLGQSLGSLVLAHDAFSLLVPDIFVDTMGYAFAVAFCKLLFPSVPTAAYVHYPTISTDMLSSLDDTTGDKGLHSGLGSGWRGWAKKRYWHLFAWLYGFAGSCIDVVMCNSTWTQGHITQLWKPASKSSSSFASIIYPPCPVEELSSKIALTPSSESSRQNIILYIAQFRPEKNHALILRSFAKYFHSTSHNASLVLIGSVRSNTPDERHVYNLRLLARELKINPSTTFICDAPFSVIIGYLQKANISVNGMWNEHFGIGNVEALAAGVIPVVHKSGGPYLDIVVPYEGKEIGYHAETDEEYAEAFKKVNGMKEDESFEMRYRGRKSASRFTEEVFAKKWVEQMQVLIDIQIKKNNRNR